MIFAYYNIDATIINYFGGISVFTIAALYIESYALGFCEYHRMFIHYCLIIDILNIIDEYYGIPVSNEHYIILLLIITAVMLFITLYLKLKRI